MKTLFLLLKKSMWFVRTHLLALVISIALFFSISGVLVRLLFPEWFVPKYGVQFTGETTLSTTEAPTVRAQREVEPDNFGAYLQEKFSLPLSIANNTSFYDPDTQISITLNPSRDVAVYTNPQLDLTQRPVSKEAGEQIARNFLSELGYGTNLQLEKIEYLHSDGLHYDYSSEEESSVYSYFFSLIQNGLPLNASTDEINFLQVLVVRDGVSSARLRPLYFSLNNQENHDIKSIQQALQEVALGEFTSDSLQQTPERQGNFLLTEKELIYLLNSETQVMEPTYRFTGTFTNERGQTLPVEVFVKAIE